MDERRADDVVARNLAQQREWYGEPLGDRVRRLVVAFAVTQSQLAEVLGISAPMLSQVMSGRRAKIGNPAVLARMVMLERRVLTPGVASGDRRALVEALEEVRASRPAVARGGLPVRDRPGESISVLSGLRELADPDELMEAARLIGPRFPALAQLLRRASEHR